MLLVVLASLAGLAVTLAALWRDPPLRAPAVLAPAWPALPSPAELSRIELPVAFPGYDPASVEVHLDALVRAYADLLAVAPPEAVERARRRAERRRGLPGVASAPAGDGQGPLPTPPPTPVPAPELGPDARGELLRSAAVLARVREREAPAREALAREAGPMSPEPHEP